MFQRKKYLLLRRCSQVLVLLAFFISPWLGIKIAHGTLSSSIWFGTIPLSDPFVLLQAMVAGHPLASSALLGGVLIVLFYALTGGRVFCGWVCPVNIVTDSARGVRRRLGWRKTGLLRIDKRLRYVILVACLLGSLASGTLIWELINPINSIVRGLVFGLWFSGLMAIAIIFLFDLFVVPGGWCGHICPVGAFYGQLGRPASIVQVAAAHRDACNNCGDCFEYCPEPQVISPALRGTNHHDFYIQDPDCLRCGRCIDVCEQKVFEFSILHSLGDGHTPAAAKSR